MKNISLKMTIITSIIVFILSMASTYAYLSYSVTNDVVIKGNIVKINATLNVELVSGTNTDMVPMMDSALNNAINGVGGTDKCIDSKGNLSCQVYKITLTNQGSTLKNLKGTIELYAKNGGVYNNLKWQELTYDEDTSKYSTKGNSNDMAKSNLVKKLTIKTKETKTWYIGVWISEIDADQRNTDKGRFGGTVTFEASDDSAVKYITNKYNNGTKTPVTTAGGEEITQVASEGLMQDSFGNIRYYGANPNNYVTFNGESAGWRIIGVFDTEDENGNVSKRVKLIRATSIGKYAYDNKPSGTGTSTNDNGSNDWADARIMMLLNPGYEITSSLYAYEGSLYWNRKSGTCYAGESSGTTSCDFTSTGLTSQAQSQIDKVKYYLGGNSSAVGYADDYYNFERGTKVYSGHQTTWNGYIGLMYPSDYAYATDLDVCTKTGNNYDADTTNCKNKDWLLDTINYTWTMSPPFGIACLAFLVNTSGSVTTAYVYYAFGVRPVAYLKLNSQIVNGTGTRSAPYIIG
mgnify:CR=1 FL=1